MCHYVRTCEKPSGYISRLLPLKKAEFLPNQAMLADMPQEEIVLSPSADVLLNTMIPNYLTGLIYGCLVEAYASEDAQGVIH